MRKEKNVCWETSSVRKMAGNINTKQFGQNEICLHKSNIPFVFHRQHKPMILKFPFFYGNDYDINKLWLTISLRCLITFNFTSHCCMGQFESADSFRLSALRKIVGPTCPGLFRVKSSSHGLCLLTRFPSFAKLFSKLNFNCFFFTFHNIASLQFKYCSSCLCHLSHAARKTGT